jgi:hypothetical protein
VSNARHTWWWGKEQNIRKNERMIKEEGDGWKKGKKNTGLMGS